MPRRPARLPRRGDDMAKFMIAHLQNGQYDGQQILSRETAQLMHSRANSPFPAGDGMAHGFYETNINGHARDRARRRHGRLPQRPAPVPRQERRHLRVVQQPGQGRRRAAASRHALLETSPTAISRKRPNAVKGRSEDAKADAEKLAGTYSTTRGSTPTSSPSPISSARRRSASTRTATRVIAAAKSLGGQPRKWIHVGPMTVARRRRP